MSESAEYGRPLGPGRKTRIQPIPGELQAIQGVAPRGDPKPGAKTTEFWLTLVAQLVGAFAASGIVGDGHWGMRVAGVVAAALAAMGYANSRGRAKATG